MLSRREIRRREGDSDHRPAPSLTRRSRGSRFADAPDRRHFNRRGRVGEMSGRVCVVTGASGGIGKETAKGLARTGATTVLLGRSRERGGGGRGEGAGEDTSE